ncbi:sulfatase family protein [Tundrisphaera sp. TA3]|uniref:sulfatase family protein n=1 Tax=Tundrisphaera sp. TA3 TaxID=3435775 RepID=UPI003EB8C4E7
MIAPRMARKSPPLLLAWLAAPIVAGLVAGRPAPAAERRPSILVILPDQWRGQDLGVMGNPDVRTPHADRLASEGLLFRHTFANTPVCCPARAILLTGKYPHKNGMMANDLRLRDEETTLAEILSRQGYRTGFIGKWHLDGGKRQPGFIPPGPRRQGFAYWAANECDHRHFRPTYFRDTPEPIVDNRYEPEVWVDRAIEFLHQGGDEPFFLVVSMGPPHDPYGAPEAFRKLYDPDKLTMRPNWEPGVDGGGRPQIAHYYAAISAVDDQVGRLIKALDDSGRGRDTIVMLTSDHGDMLGSQGERLKRKPWEESIRVPGIVRYPAGIKPGRVTDAFLSHVDMAPTLLALCGIAAPGDMQGADLSGVVLGREGAASPDSVFFQLFVPYASDHVPHPWRGVRTEHFMYARSEDGPWVLYNIKADPYERSNMAHVPGSAHLLHEMEVKLADWMRKTGDAWTFNTSVPVDDKGRLYRYETFTTIQEYLDWAAKHPGLAPVD